MLVTSSFLLLPFRIERRKGEVGGKGAECRNARSTDANISVSVLLDFGNTEYEWADLNLTNLADLNNSAFNATVEACHDLELEFDYSTYDYGVFVNAIGGVANAEDWSESWSLYEWNDTEGIWGSSPVGCDQLILSTGDAICWLYDNWGDAPPVPTPLYRDPVLTKNEVLIDFGNGTYRWEDVILPVHGNVSAFDATVKACGEMGFELDHSELSYGIFINAIGGLENEADWSESWSLYSWNATDETWDSASVGCDSLLLSTGDRIAWLYDNWGDAPPVPTPLVPEPALTVCEILFDFGNGSYLWEDVVMEEGSTGQDAFEKAAEELDLTLNVTKYYLGSFISGVGGINGEGDWFWSVLVLEDDSWVYSDIGAGDIELANHSALALYYTVWGSPFPPAKPGDMTPDAAAFEPGLTDHGANYTGNLTYRILLTLNSSYNPPGTVTVHVGNTTVEMVRDPANISMYSINVGVEGNFTYYFSTSLGAHGDSTAPTESAPAAVNVWRHRKEAGELEPEDDPTGSENEVRTEVSPGEQEVVQINNTNGQGSTRITVMGNGTLVVKAMDWEEAGKRAGEMGDDFSHLDFFLEITLDELECMDIEIPYDEAKLPEDVNIDSLGLYFWNASDGRWERVPDTNVDRIRNMVLANVTHLTIFAPLAMKNELAGGDEKEGSNLNLIMIILVIGILVVVFISILVWSKRRGGNHGIDADDEVNDDKGYDEELND